ncbi:polysaccharide pyruvyl transferase family protein [Sphingomonas faeni]|uniref:polysaccharide pyruvyl transferase family protein n=1 Tax=Sphingomonas faeni TaxID=185950 RepID=UPI0020C75523|nr:polysaccharide pyruvyl transferase family protein [Sphingomonas faeni]MCP8890320.1 polysaccharide pyruvyl transferase family protein [Sphingomonas faeni]
MRRILIHGYFGGRNFGDELMLLGFLNREVRPSDRVAIITPNGTVPLHLASRVERAFAKKPASFLKGLIWATDFVLCGGTVFHDGYPDDRHTSYRKNLIAVAALLRVARLAGRRVHLAAIGLGPLRRPLTRYTARIALGSATTIGLRDDRSVTDAIMLGFADRFTQVRDLAHDSGLDGLRADVRRGLALSVVSTNLISTTDPITAAAFYDDLADLIATFQARTGEPVRLLIICVGSADSDVGVSESWQRRLHAVGVRDLTVVPFNGSPAEMAGELARVRGVIAMRFHAATLAQKIGTPTFWLAYQRKVLDGAADLAVPHDRIGTPVIATLPLIAAFLDSL